MKITFFLYSQHLSMVLNEIKASVKKINKYFGYRITLLIHEVKTKKIKVLRSPFVNKKSREKFYLKVDSTKIVVYMKSHKKNIRYIKYFLQYLNKKFDVALKIVVCENSSIGRV